MVAALLNREFKPELFLGDGEGVDIVAGWLVDLKVT